jgi:hypothetical protein
MNLVSLRVELIFFEDSQFLAPYLVPSSMYLTAQLQFDSEDLYLLSF